MSGLEKSSAEATTIPQQCPTPGPWEIVGEDKHGQIIVGSPHIEICTCWHHSVGAIEKEMGANARLIAAAPDLYAALELFYRLKTDGFPIPQKAMERARLALIKAKATL